MTGIDVHRFASDGTTLLYVFADMNTSVQAWYEGTGEPVALGSCEGFHSGSLKVAPDAEHVRLRLAIDGFMHTITARWPKPEPASKPEVLVPFKRPGRPPPATEGAPLCPPI